MKFRFHPRTLAVATRASYGLIEEQNATESKKSLAEVKLSAGENVSEGKNATEPKK